MDLRFFTDPETGLAHVLDHGVTEEEVREVMSRPTEDFKARDNSRIALGQTASGRYLQVVYVPDEVGDAAFVVTAYDLRGKPLKSLRRRKRRKGK